MTARTIGGLIPAPHTPLTADGKLNVRSVAQQVARFVETGVSGAFVGGTTGECLSLSLAERLELAEAWIAAASGTNLAMIIQVGGNCLSECQTLAERAERAGADAIAALAPCFFRPANVDQLIDWCRRIAERAPSTPFYFYDIPGMTNVRLPMAEFLRKGREAIPTFQGLKYSNDDLIQLQECLAVAPDHYRILFGFDELLLAGLALGVHGAVGNTYNFEAELYLELMSAFARGDLQTAQRLQLRSVQLIRCLGRYGFMAATKTVMEWSGIDCGPARPPVVPLTSPQRNQLRAELESLGFVYP